MRRPFALAQHHVVLARGTRVVLQAAVEARGGYLCKAGTVGRIEAADHPRYVVTTPGGRTIDCGRDQLVIQKQRMRASARRQVWDWDQMRGHVVLSVVVGSRAWNLADANSDTDRKGVFLLPFEAASGLWQPPDEIRAPDTDAQYWEVRKVIDQGLRADANTLEMLWSPHVERADAVGELIRRERDMFVSKRIYNAFGRYAISQFEKIGQKLRHVEIQRALRADAQESPERPRAEVEATLVRAGLCRDAKAARKNIDRQVDSLFDRGLIAQRAWPAAQAWLAQIGAEVWEAQATYRPKNAYNLLRLLHSGMHWLTTGSPLIAIEPDRPDGLRERLMAIKRSEVPIEEVLEEAHALAARFEQAWEASDLPDEGDADAADALLRACRAQAARRSFALPDARALAPDPEPVVLRAPRFELPEHALRVFLERYAHLDPVVMSVTGAHNFGFPSPDSDVDLKGIHLLPLADVLKAAAPKETVDFLGFVDLPDGEGATVSVEADYTSHDARKAVGLLLRGNGNILEVLHSPYQLLPGPDAPDEAHRRLDALRALSLANLGTHYARHYQGFFTNKRRDFERSGALKALLYAYRIALTGIHLMREGDVLPDLGRLIDLYPRWKPTVAPLIEAKVEGAEKMTTDALDAALIEAAGRDMAALEEALSEAIASSPLPSAPPDPDAFDAWLAYWRTTPTR